MSREFKRGELQAARAAESAARAERVIGTTPSEDVSHLLPPLTIPSELAEREPGPFPWLEYVIDLVGAESCSRSRLLTALNERVLEELTLPSLYGRPVGQERWGLVHSASVGQEFAELAVGWNMAPPEGEPPSASVLRRHRDYLAHRLRPLGLKARPREAVEAAVQRGDELMHLRENWDVGVALVLRAPWLRRFDTRELWDAAYALGMKWGHLELFHWHNSPESPGAEHLFSLWSVEEPGTFTPEWVAAGMTVPEVALGFSIARSPDPLGVFDRMVAAGRYLQSRLGGKLLVGQVAIATEQVLNLWRGRVLTAAGELTGAGFPPGSSRTLQLF